MKKSTQLLAFIILSTQLFGTPKNNSNDEYQLRSNVEIAKQQQNYIENMSRILKLDIKDKESFNISKNLFNEMIKGLIKDKKSKNLNSMELRKMNLKISKIKNLWRDEHKIFDMALSDNKSRLRAINTVDKLAFYMRGVVKVHSKTYLRYTKEHHLKPSSLFAKEGRVYQLMVMK